MTRFKIISLRFGEWHSIHQLHIRDQGIGSRHFHHNSTQQPQTSLHLGTELLRNRLGSRIVHPKRRMQRVQPKILVHAPALTALVIRIPRLRPVLIVLTVIGRIRIRRRLRVDARIVEHGGEERVRVEEEDARVGVRAAQVGGEGGDVGVEGGDRRGFVCDAPFALADGQGRAVDGRHVEEEEVARAGLVQGVDQTSVSLEVGGEDVARVGLVVRVADVVDAEEGGEERVVALPGEGALRAVGVEGQELVFDLVAHGEDCREVLGDEALVDHRAAVGQVERLERRGVVGCGEEVDPVGPVGGGVAWVGRVAEGVAGGGLGAVGVEARGCVAMGLC